MSFRIQHFAVGLAVLALSCGGGSDGADPVTPLDLVGGQTGGEAGLNCVAGVPVSPLELTEASALGYAASDVLAEFTALPNETIDWADGDASQISFAITFDGRCGYAASCRANEVDVTLGVSTADGALAEQLHGELFAPRQKAASLRIEIEVAAIHGALAEVHALPSGAKRIVVTARLSSEGARGQIEAVGADAPDSVLIAEF
jgi:hypothetical protein